MFDLLRTIRNRVKSPGTVAVGRKCLTGRPPIYALHAALLLSVTSFCGQSQAQTSAPSQFDVEAVYLYNFAKFVRWPPGGPGHALDVCVAGQRVYLDKLNQVVAGERIDERPLAVRAIQRPEDEAGCDILFIDATAKERLDSLLAAAADKPVLTVSDLPDFLDRGGMIQFILVNSRIRFSVDLRPTTHNGITLSSELLKVAVAVNGQPVGGGAK